MQASSRSFRLMGTIIETRIWHPQAEPILDRSRRASLSLQGSILCQ